MLKSGEVVISLVNERLIISKISEENDTEKNEKIRITTEIIAICLDLVLKIIN